ncbi:MAG: OsmC family protein [Pseudomonadota bacterium]
MAVREKTTVRLKAEAQCTSHSRAEISVRNLTFDIDEPIERGGTNHGPTPTDTALAALAGCTNVIGHKCAKKLGIDIGNLQIKLSCEFDRRGVTLTHEIDTPFVAIDQTVIWSGEASEAEIQALSAEVEKYCPLAKLFVGSGTQLRTTWTKA